MIIKGMSWRQLNEGILRDELPANREKYVRYSNLASINQRMVKYYLERGFEKPEKRKILIRGILEEMRRSSTARYDIQDGGNQ
mgnify:CR=1 FL=1|tara:strand:- start:1438 stop:1686 length:249 start_codon:yes stop_codon:yes gene_type:complete